MASDITLPIDDGFVNIRVGAVITRGGKFLMAGNKRDSYLYSVGGRVKFGETAEEAVEREVYEETGVRMKAQRLAFVHENYFIANDPGKLGRTIYEVSFFFYMQVPADFEPICNSITGDGVEEFLTWAAPDDERKLFPEFFRTELSRPCEGIRHFVTDERPKETHQ